MATEPKPDHPRITDIEELVTNRLNAAKEIEKVAEQERQDRIQSQTPSSEPPEYVELSDELQILRQDIKAEVNMIVEGFGVLQKIEYIRDQIWNRGIAADENKMIGVIKPVRLYGHDFPYQSNEADAVDGRKKRLRFTSYRQEQDLWKPSVPTSIYLEEGLESGYNLSRVQLGSFASKSPGTYFSGVCYYEGWHQVSIPPRYSPPLSSTERWRLWDAVSLKVISFSDHPELSARTNFKHGLVLALGIYSGSGQGTENVPPSPSVYNFITKEPLQEGTVRLHWFGGFSHEPKLAEFLADYSMKLGQELTHPTDRPKSSRR